LENNITPYNGEVSQTLLSINVKRNGMP